MILKVTHKKIIENLPVKEDNTETINLNNFKKDFEEAMDDDFNTAKALGILFELVKEVNLLKDKAIRENRISKSLRSFN